MKLRFCLSLLPLLGVAAGTCAQSSRAIHRGEVPPPIAIALWAARPAAAEEAGPEDDPGYALYREGYALVLEEQWDAAIARFNELLSRYPNSTYVDDARYWSAYALKNIDSKKAIEAYESFLRKHRQSRYYPDAMADLTQLRLDRSWSARVRTFMAVTAPDAEGNSYTIAVAPHLNGVERQVRFYSTHGEQLHRVREVDAARLFREYNVDPLIRLKVQALTTIGKGKEDAQSYDALKEIALDQGQPPVLRIAAVNSLAAFRKHDALPVLEEIARSDTAEDLQYTAIGLIGSIPHDKDRAVKALSDLFDSLPPDRSSQMETTLFAIADVGNERAVDFLARVATTHRNFDLRGDAVFYLSNIGSERARAALMEILKAK